MDSSKKKKMIIAGIVILILAAPFALLLNPVLKKFQEKNVEMHDRLIEKMGKGEEVEKEWENLKYRQKLIADIYRYSFREHKAIKAFEKYLEWFQDDWKSEEYMRIKFDIAKLYVEVARQNAEVREEYFEKAACHLQEVADWYKGINQEFRKKANSAMVTYDLREYARDCRSNPSSVWN